MTLKSLYNRDGWVLCSCANCGKLNYVEPHGTTAACKCPQSHLRWREHLPIPGAFRTGYDKVITVNGRLPKKAA